MYASVGTAGDERAEDLRTVKAPWYDAPLASEALESCIEDAFEIAASYRGCGADVLPSNEPERKNWKSPPPLRRPFACADLDVCVSRVEAMILAELNLLDGIDFSTQQMTLRDALYLRHLPHDPGISVLKPHVYGTVTSQVRKAIINFLLRSFDVSADEAALQLLLPEKVSQWGKISFVDEGDTIRCREPVQHSERNMTRDASFLKNHNHRRERRAVHGQLLRIIEFDAGFPRAAPHHLLLAVIHPVQALYYKSNPNTPYYQEEKFKPLEVVDVDDMSCLVARVPDRYHETGPRLWALCERPDTMGAGADEES
ncbi:hypothetical protein GGX14DRAFT_561026 [Mycena pura]|uniref:Uncharacterized protein n=1 Tax=Mycena pura TaxID=153505 RepID=A0AAD6VP39_9AGAR|nr:hypothetical protein GGX14DRAFT_561026 [Mycena pura]